jgi:hypothetical protein
MWQWAVTRLSLFIESDNAFRRKRPFHLWGDTDPDTGEHRIHVAVAEAIKQSDEWVFQIGDILHNLRTSLDYAAFAVARAKTPGIVMDERRARDVFFPISESPKSWQDKKKSVAAWAGDALDDLERLQPYHHPFLKNYHPLLLLDQLNRPHKHRRLLSAAPNCTSIDFEDGPGFEFTRNGLEGRFEDGAVIARGHFRRGTDGKRGRLNMWAEFEIAFHEDGPAPMYPARQLLGEIAAHIEREVFPALEKHL